MSAGPAGQRAGILRLAAPLVVSFWLRSAFAWIDPIFAAQLEGKGDPSLAAIGLTLPFEFLMIACWVGTSNGLTSRLAAAMGAGEGARVEQLKKAASRIIYALCGGFLLLAVALWFLPGRFGLEPLVAEQFRIYATVLVGGSAFTSFWSILPDSLIKAHHDTRTTMWAGILSSVLNTGLNTLFVFVFHWGIFGIAFSTVLGRVAGLVYAVIKANQHERRRIAGGRDDRPDVYAAPVRAILVLAVPGAITYALMAVESQAVNVLLARSPDSTPLLAAWSIFDRSVRFMAMPLIATSVAMLPLVARRWGQGDRAAIRHELRVAQLAGLVYVLLLVWPAGIWLGPWVARELGENAATREFAALSMKVLVLAVASMLPFFVQRSAFDGMAMPRPGLVVSVVRTAVFVLPLTLLGLHLADRWDEPLILGACFGYTAGVALSSALLSLWMRATLSGRAA